MSHAPRSPTWSWDRSGASRTTDVWPVLVATLWAAIAVAGCSGEPATYTPTWESTDAPPQLVELNAEIDALGAAITTPDSPVLIVNQFDGFDAIDDTFDGVHPTPSGEAKIATTWETAIKPVLASHSDPEPRVLLLGDSITDNHYRTILWRSLRDAGYQFDLVGSQHSYPLRAAASDLSMGGETFDTDHEGHTGWTADELLVGSQWDPAGGGGLNDWLAEYTPDIVALHIGTNDLIIGSLTPAEIAVDIGEVIEKLRSSNPNVVILLAQIIPYLPLEEPGDSAES